MLANYFINFLIPIFNTVPPPPGEILFLILCLSDALMVEGSQPSSFVTLSHLLLSVVQRLSLKLGPKSLTPIAHTDTVPVCGPLIVRNRYHEILI